MKTKALPELRSQRRTKDPEAWLCEAQGGSEAALKLLMDVTTPILVSWLLRGRCRDPELAQSIVQDAWVEAWQRMREFVDVDHLHQWLFVVTRNMAVSHIRREVRAYAAYTEFRMRMLEDLRLGEAAGGRPPVEESGVIELLLGDLSPRQRAAILLHYRHGLSVRRVAELSNSTRGAIKTTLYRARLVLARSLKPE